MKTLVVHPKDKTTDYLSDIYSDKKDWTVINQEVSFSDLSHYIGANDRIVMLGHGCSRGMFGYGGFVIDRQVAPLLWQKECVGIWCYADGFFKEHNLKGLYTGMIISEYAEAVLYLENFSTNHVGHSNRLFAKAFRQHIDEKRILEKVLAEYVDGENPIIEFNRKNIFVI